MTRTFIKTSKQSEAIDLMARFPEVLLEGGSRSGKTAIEIYAFLARGFKYPGSRHIAVRKHFNHAKLSLWYQTIPNIFAMAFPGVKYKENKSDWFVEFGEGSQLWIGGTDDKERIEKILGSEWDGVLLNEISEQSYNTYELLKTRLNPGAGVKPLFLMDQNPPTKAHWSFIKFHELKNPETKQPLNPTDAARQTFIKMNPMDNAKNLNESYLITLNSLSEKKQARFLKGDYSDDAERALWKRDWIMSTRLTQRPSHIWRIVVAVDPNVTEDMKVDSNTDEAGIITVGQFKIKDEDHYVVLSDDTTPGLSWGEESVAAFRRNMADKIVAEVNQGGDLVKMNIRNHDRAIADYHFESVHAARDKATRAEPVADLYRMGRVHHLGDFPALEDELCTWVPGERSPNRLDALVWGISYLAGINFGSKTELFNRFGVKL